MARRRTDRRQPSNGRRSTVAQRATRRRKTHRRRTHRRRTSRGGGGTMGKLATSALALMGSPSSNMSASTGTALTNAQRKEFMNYAAQRALAPARIVTREPVMPKMENYIPSGSYNLEKNTSAQFAYYNAMKKYEEDKKAFNNYIKKGGIPNANEYLNLNFEEVAAAGIGSK